MTLLRFSSAPPACKICGGATSSFGAVDFNRACGGTPDFALPQAGVRVPYHRCSQCGLIFTEAFDDWTQDDFGSEIYNQDYVRIDPEYPEARPVRNALYVDNLFGRFRSALKVLDYGGGNGRLAEALRARQWRHVATFDPFSAAHRERPLGRFDLITCFETLEHLPDPAATLADIVSFLADDGIVFFSTLLTPEKIAEIGVGWWYIAPRNGHITFYSDRALGRAWAAQQLKCYSLNENFHAAVRGAPTWARFEAPP